MTVLKKGEVEALFAEHYGVTKKDAREQLEGIYEFFEEVLVEHQAGFQFGNVGRFEVNAVEEKTHTRRNPQTQETFEQTVPAHMSPKFKFSKGQESVRAKLKEA